jgi:hypothetical protein
MSLMLLKNHQLVSMLLLFLFNNYFADIDVADYIETNLSVDRNRKQIVKLLRELMLVTKDQLKPTK